MSRHEEEWVVELGDHVYLLDLDTRTTTRDKNAAFGFVRKADATKHILGMQFASVTKRGHRS